MESARSVLSRLPVIDYPDLMNETHRNFSFKHISLYAAINYGVSVAGDFAEFGVFKGRCARIIERLLPPGAALHLFDSFEGLPSDWGSVLKAGHFALDPKDIPKFGSRCVVHKGWFKDTVPPFAPTQIKPLAFIHADADIYDSTIEFLYPLNHLIVPGTIILFDEYAIKSASGYSDDEHRALHDWASRYSRTFTFMWRTMRTQVAVRVSS